MAPDEKCFTFLWKLENVSYCLQRKGERIFSPVFVVDAIDGTKWKLALVPRGESDGNYIACFLFREAGKREADKIEIKYELALIAKDGSVLVSKDKYKSEFSKDTGRGFEDFQSRADVYTKKRDNFIPDDILRVRCRIWKSEDEMTEDIRCTAHTRIGVEKRSFLWNIKQFSTLELDSKCSYQINSIKNGTPLMSIDLCLTGGLSSEDIIHFKLSLHDKSIKFSTLQLCLIDAVGNRVECNREEIWFQKDKNKQFTFFFTKEKLLAKKSTYLPGDILSMHWELAFPKGVVLEEIEEVQYGI